MKAIAGQNIYRVEKQIGKGSFGTVYKDGAYAIKQIKNNQVPIHKDYIQTQLKILREINHKNLVKVHQIIYKDSWIFIVMELCDSNLREYIRQKYRKENKIQEVEVAKIMKQIVEGYVQLSRQKIVHRDLKPENILIKDKYCKITDFGTSKIMVSDNQLLQSKVGTPLYMAPQIFESRTSYTKRCDIWSLGIIFYQLLFNRLPWIGSSQKQFFDHLKYNKISIPAGRISQLAMEILYKMLNYYEERRIDVDELQSYFDIYQQSFAKIQEKIYHKSKICKMLRIQADYIQKSLHSAGLQSIVNNEQQLQVVRATVQKGLKQLLIEQQSSLLPLLYLQNQR